MKTKVRAVRKLLPLAILILLLPACRVTQPIADYQLEPKASADITEQIVSGRTFQTVYVGDIACDPIEVEFFYKSMLLSFLNENGEYIAYYGLDIEIPLTEQECMFLESGTWDDFFYQDATGYLRETIALWNEASIEGLSLSDFYDEVDILKESFLLQFEDEQELTALKESYGANLTAQLLFDYIEKQELAMLYSMSIQDEILAAAENYSDDDIRLFYQNSEQYDIRDYKRTVNVRHILVDSEDTALELATLARYNPTDEYFASLAEQYSTDDGSKYNGGLYEGIKTGDMIEEFEAWCLSPVRLKRDIGIVQTIYGYHVMFFSGVSDGSYWKTFAKDELPQNAYRTRLDSILEKYPLM